MNSFTISVATATRVAYVIDAHGANAAHILTLTESVMYLLTYSATFLANGIVLSAGVRRTLLVVAAIQAACWLTCVPVYVFGKRVRSFIARHPRLFRGHDLMLPRFRNSDSSTCRPSTAARSFSRL
uniref:Uncharacterized protein n=1 Tax=Ganoderma boninense TaxID=34458 RepID=A0A5K1JYE5_9APHY|nr:Uncharacterized protein [Ganoderma boninense]